MITVLDLLTQLGRLTQLKEMGTIERKQRQKEEVYDSILTAAWKLVKEEGWQGLSIRKIAEAIEYSIPVIYDHFENKEAILSEFTRQGFSLLNKDLILAGKKITDPVDHLRSVTFAYWNFAFENQEFYQLMYGMGMPGCETVNEMKELRELIETLRNTILHLYEGRVISENESLTKMKSFWSMLHGLVSIQMMAREKEIPDLNDPVLNESVNNFLAGIKH
ncbi:TetR/AcrR family transcriptional regulator [Flavitalea sp.]|nr:TetR/AcrR family transcriptional regulator [Flavitalea sp.]